MATDPAEHPIHKVPDTFPLPPGDLPPSTEPPALPPQPQLPQDTGSASRPYQGEPEDESGDPVGKPPRL